MSDDMIERARRIVAEWAEAPERNAFYGWAEALLAEHEARVAAERERDEAREQNREAWASIANLRTGLDDAEARVATLEAALREIADDEFYSPDSWGIPVMYGTQKIARAALGDQFAPTEPPTDLLCRPGAPCSARCERCCPLGYCENCGKTMREHGPLANCYVAAPQEAT